MTATLRPPPPSLAGLPLSAPFTEPRGFARFWLRHTDLLLAVCCRVVELRKFKLVKLQVGHHKRRKMIEVEVDDVK